VLGDMWEVNAVPGIMYMVSFTCMLLHCYPFSLDTCSPGTWAHMHTSQLVL
jgi:hypothetical protein